MHSRNLLLTTASLFCCEQCSQMLKSCRPSQRFSCLLCASNSHCSQVCTISVLLGHIASVVGVSVCLLVTTMSCVKSAELINTIWDVDSSGPKELYILGGGLDVPRRRGNFGAISWPIVKYREYPVWAKVIWYLAAAMSQFVVSTATTCY